jgi:LacI family transcriptional regulator
MPRGWSGDGIIARLSSQTQAEHVRQAAVPAVDVDMIMADRRGLGRVVTDDVERARLALDHLLDRGFERFAHFAPSRTGHATLPGECFRAAVEAAGYDCAVYRPGHRARRRIGWSEQQMAVSRWLASLADRVAIFAADAHCGRQLAEICQVEGISVPDQVAILAGDTDELMCNVSTPSLSSVLLASERIGYDAAALLDRLMSGRRVPNAPTYVKPLSVTSRQSTDVLAIENAEVVEAIRFIRSHATDGIVVADVLKQVPVSRRWLEMRFQQYLGRSPADEIRRVRLAKAARLLAHSDLSIARIAEACGFPGATRLGIVFRKHFGQTPLAYRRQAHPRARGALLPDTGLYESRAI